MSDSISLTESTATYLLTQFFKGLSEQQQLEFMEQVVLPNTGTHIEELIAYIKNKNSYYHPKKQFRIGDYVMMSTEALWSTDLEYYQKNNLIREKHFMVKVIKIKIIEKDRIIIAIKGKNGYSSINTISSYIKKIDLY